MTNQRQTELASDSTKRWRAASWSYGILSLGAALRLVGLGTSALHYDEAFSLVIVRQDLLDMVRALTQNISPPGWEIGLWLITRLLGFSELASRVLPLLANIATLWVVYRLAQ